MPVKTPAASIVPTDDVTLLHVPPGAASDNVVVNPGQANKVTVIVPALGSGFTVTVVVVLAEPQASTIE